MLWFWPGDTPETAVDLGLDLAKEGRDNRIVL